MTIQVLKPKYHVEECLNEIRECLEIGWTGLGFKTVEFENKWKEYTGHENAHFLNSATVGLHLAVEILKKEGIDDPVLFGAICAHNPKSGVKAKTKIQYALLAADPMSGFLKAVAQIYPDKKIASVKRKSVIKRFNEARFAKGANRDYMESIEFTGLMLEDLIDIGLEEMCAISDELGL
mgnify:CR=1 FL=1